MSADKDYVLGTHDEEITRLGLQHRIWLPQASAAWRQAGFRAGQTIVDLGCGPGWATVDLAGIVGPTGRAIGLERSRRFLDAAEARARALELTNTEFHELDLDTQPLPVKNADGVWTRWVYSFVSQPRAVLAKAAAALRPGGAMVMLEYVDYRTWRISPRRPEFEQFVQEVMSSWIENGGTPDIGMQLPQWLEELDFDVRVLRPIMEAVRPQDHLFEWPQAFVDVGLQRLVDLRRVTAAQADGVRRAYRESQATAGAFQTTPTVLEIIAIKRG